MVVDIYGVEADDFRCGGCELAKSLFNEAKIPYNFIRVLTRGPDQLPKYDMPAIDALVKRAKFPNRQIRYPIIFVDGDIVNIKNLQSFLEEKGYEFY